METPEFRTQRLRLSPLVASDAPAMFEYRSDPEVCCYQSFEPGTIRDVEKFISSIQSTVLDTPGTWFQFAIRLQESGQLIGDFGTHFNADDPRQVEIGFTVSPTYQGRGYGAEAVVGALDYIFGSLQKHRVYASVDPRNRPSIRLLKHVGMRQEAHFLKSLWFKDDWVDDIVFGILESEWKSRQ